MLKSQIYRMNELRKITIKAALAVGSSFLLLFICTFRVSNTTTLFMLCAAALLVVVSILSTSKYRYLLLFALILALALEMILRSEGSGLYQLSVIMRFTVAGLLITYFATLISQASQQGYLGMQRLADEREQALEQSRRWLGRLNALVGVISAIGTRSRLREIFTESLEEARKVLRADSGLIYSVDRTTGGISIISSFGYNPDVLDKMKEKGVKDVSSCLACTRMEPIAVDNLATDEKCKNLAKVNSGSSICLPIVSGNNLWGVLHLRRKHPAAFTAEDVQLAQALTYQFGLAMQRAALFEQINRLAITDSLTGLYNHRKMNRDMMREITRSKRYDHSFSFIMADIDHFKALNDKYGHPAGDVVLKKVAAAMEEGRREVDRVYRYGGEEFSVLLPETSGSEAGEVAEKIKNNVESLSLDLEAIEDSPSITISMGIADFPHDSTDLDGIVGSADEALYVAKEAGRNRIVRFSDLEEGPARRAHPQPEVTAKTTEQFE